ncbi:MAG: ATP-dependent Clp protease ATP-binding subunit [Patescibacteria group bacterium]|nr:ATP-dependent Clp protease ATP-binding subunit [Patescibacteria group bacterium]
MEVAKFTKCSECGGRGKKDGRKCPLCFGHQEYFFDNNNFFYWEKPIGYSYIFVREFKNIINIIINFVLIVAVLLNLFLIAYILLSLEMEPIKILDFFQRPGNRDVFWICLLFIVNMFLYYRLSYVAEKKKTLGKNLKDSAAYVRYNIAQSLGPTAEGIVDKAWLYARYKKVFPLTVWHLLFSLLNDKEIRLVLARLGLGADNIKQQVDQNLAELVKGEDSGQEISATVKDALLNAYMHMRRKKTDYISEVDLLFGLMAASERLRNMFYDFNVDQDKINNVIAWVDINKELYRRYRALRSRALFKPKSGMNRSYTATATPLLNSFSQDLTMAAKAGHLPLTVAREREMEEVISAIESSFASVILVGPTGVGRNRIVEGIANRMMAEDLPELFQDKRLVSISVPLLVSGGSDLEGRFLAILHEAAVSGNIILYVENIHQLVGISSQGNQGIDLASVLASEIRNKNIIVISDTSHKDYVQYIEHSPLGEVLKKINILEPDKNQTIQMMQAHVGAVEAKHKVYFTYDALEKIFQLSSRYITDVALPKKAIDLMDEVGILVAKSPDGNKLVRSEDVARLLSSKINVPLTEVSQDESSKLLNLEQEIHQRVIGQAEAVKMVAAALRRARSEIRDIKRPIVNLLFLGPTGVGKTELAKTVAEKYFGNEKNMIRLDMSEYQSQSSLPRLIGSPQLASAGLLTEAVRHQPFALLLLDEIEKAHPEVLNIFLQVMEDGRLTDALGRTVDFTNLIIVATSNAGTEYIQDQINAGHDIDDFKDDLVKNRLRDVFRPEFLNRFDAVMVFKPLKEEEIFAIAGLMLKGVQKRLKEKGIFFEYSEAAQRELAQAGFDPVFGARPLRRAIQERVDNALADFLLQGKIGRRDIVFYDAGDKISIKKPTGY